MDFAAARESINLAVNQMARETEAKRPKLNPVVETIKITKAEGALGDKLREAAARIESEA